jgi:hypothetical protein
VNVGSLNEYVEPVDLTTSQLAGFTLSFNPAGPVTPPGQAVLTLEGDGSAIGGGQTVAVTGTSGSLSHQADLLVNVFIPLSSGPQLLSPANGAANVEPGTSFTWQALEGALSYRLEVALDAGFTQVVLMQGGLSGTTYTPTAALQTDTIYYWRVTAENPCGETNENQVFNFRTRPGPGDCPAGTTAHTLYLGDFEDGALDWADTSTGCVPLGVIHGEGALPGQLLVRLGACRDRGPAPGFALVRAACGGFAAFAFVLAPLDF